MPSMVIGTKPTSKATVERPLGCEADVALAVKAGEKSSFGRAEFVSIDCANSDLVRLSAELGRDIDE